MRNVAPMALLMLAGLAAVSFVPTASALCADDGNGGCTAPRHDLALAVGPCADDASKACLLGAPDVDVQSVWSGLNNLTVSNQLSVALDFEVFVTARLDDAVNDDGTPLRVRADKLFTVHVAAGQSLVHEFTVDGNASTVRFQALTADARQAELDGTVLHIMTMMGGPGNPEDSPVDPDAEDLADDSGLAGDGKARKDAPGLGAALLMAALVGAAAVVSLRRID